MQLSGFTSFAAEDQKILITLGQSPSRILVASLNWYNQEDRKFNNFLPWRDFKYGSTKDPFKEKLIGYADKIARLRIDAVEAALLNNLIIFATGPRVLLFVILYKLMHSSNLSQYYNWKTICIIEPKFKVYYYYFSASKN